MDPEKQATEDTKTPNPAEAEPQSGRKDASITKPASQPTASTHQMDRGSSAWLTVAGGWAIMFCVFGYSNAFGVFQDLYTRNGTASASDISWIGSTQVFLMIAMSLPAGKLVDMGYFRHMLFAGMILYTFFIFMLSLAHTNTFYQLFLSQGVGMGLSGGFLYLPAIAIQARHWKARRALAIGIVFSGSALGGVIWPIMLNRLIHNSGLGFGWAVRVSAFMVLGLLVLANLIMSPGVEPPKIPRAEDTSTYEKYRNMLTDVPFVIVTIASVLINVGFYFPYFYIQLYSILHGIDANTSFYMLSIINAASVFGRVGLAWTSDRFGSFNMYILSCLATAVLLFALFGITHTGSVIAFCVLYGFFTGGVISLIAPALATIVVKPSEIATRMGAAYFVIAFGSLIGPPINGALVGSTVNPSSIPWWRPIVFSGCLMIGGTSGVLAARFMVVKRKGTQRV